MRSTRLPGKVMKEILGEPLIGILLKRLKKAKEIDKIILATSTNHENDLLSYFVKKIGIEVFRGSEEDVLSRYYYAVKPYAPKAVVRITADCPLIDPRICDEVVETYKSNHCDYVHTGPTFCEGLDCEIFSFRALETAFNRACLKSEREHMPLYFHNHPEIFKTIKLVNKSNDSRYRFTVDEREDFLVVKAILEGLGKNGSYDFSAEDVKGFLDRHPDVFRLNSRFIRNEGLIKSLSSDARITHAK